MYSSCHVSLTTDNQKRPNAIRINEFLAEVLDSRAQHDDADLSEQPDRSDSINAQRWPALRKFLSEGSNTQRKANAAAKPTNRKMRSEDENEADQTKSKALEKKKVHSSSKFC